MRSLIRPAPERGGLVAAAGVALTITVFVVNLRFDDKWGVGIHLAYGALAAALVIAIAAAHDRSADGPSTWHSTLFIVAFVLSLLALGNLADVLGSDDGISSSGTLFWIGSLLVALMVWFSTRFDSGISTLLAAATSVVVVVAFVDWTFSPDGAGTFRWVLLFTALGLAALGERRRSERPEHAVGFVNAAGLAILGIAVTYAVEGLGGLFGGGGSVDAAWGWELVLVTGGAALVVYSARAHLSGPGYLGAINLLAYTLLAATTGDDGPSLIGWPIVLILVSAGLLMLALRPDEPSHVGPPAPAQRPAPSP